MVTSISDVTETLSRLSQIAHDSDTEGGVISDIKSGWQQYSHSATNVISLAAIDPTIGTMMFDGSDDEFRGIDAQTRVLMELARGKATSALQGEIAGARRMSQEAAVSALFIIALGALIMWFVIRSIAMPITSITRAMSQVSLGIAENLTEHVDRADEIGQMARAISAFQNVLAADQRSLREQNLRLKAVISNIPQGLALYDHTGRLIIDNQQHAKLYSQLRREIGSLHSDVFADKLRSRVYKDPDRVRSEVSDALETKINSDFSVALNDGRTIAVSYSHIQGGGWVETHKDATVRRKAEAKIKYIAYHDVLTDLPNRRFFNERLSEKLRFVSHGKRLAVRLLDLNEFKKVNDRFGHAAGDDLLVQVAHRLRSCLGEADFCARLGGDEFVIIQFNPSSFGEAETLATNILQIVGKSYELAIGDLTIELSVGIAFAPEHGSDFDVLMRNADAALYEAKKAAGGSFRCFDDAMRSQSHRRRRLEEKLRESLELESLSNSYQPIFDAGTGGLTGFEALCRWHDADEGEISPSEFIPIAEETGLINQLGRLVLNRACLAATKWPRPVRIAVNASPMQFRSGNLANDIREALSNSGLSPSRLEIEVTESSLLSATEEIQSALKEIESLGVRIVIDDFGTGYSGLSYLTSFRFDKLKIDRGFVRELQNNGDRRAIVKAIAHLCRELGIATVAEGVETQEEFQSLLEAGCTEVQGYLFSPPLRADQLQQVFDNDIALRIATLNRVAA